MGGECFCYSWTCGPVWPVFIILAAIPRTLHCIESPAVSVGKMNPRGNHWAVGHLMGKKSIESLPELQETNGVYITPLEAAVVTESDRYWPLMEALMQHKKQKQTMPPTADRLLRLHIGWREDDRDKYLREMSDLPLLALKLLDSEST